MANAIAFLHRFSIRNRMWALVLLFVAATFMGGIADVATVRHDLLREKEANITQLVEVAHSVLVSYYQLQQSGRLTEAAAKAAAVETIKAMRYDGTEYFWINDLGRPFPKMIMHPTMPALDGKVLNAVEFNHASGARLGRTGPYTAANGEKNIFVAFVEVADNDGEGYVTYDWPKPLTDGGVTATAYPKVSFIKKFEPWGWVVGTGIYIDDIDRAVHAKAIRNVLVVAGAGIALSLIAIALARSIIRPLQITVSAMRAVADADEDAVRPLPSVGVDEIAQLAKAFNDMVARLHQRDLELARHRQQLEEEVSRRTAELREANALLNQEVIEHHRLSTALSQSGEAIIISSPDLRFIYVNPAFTRLFGYEMDEVRGKPLTLLAVSDQSQPNPEQTTEIALTNGAFGGEVLRQTKDGSAVHVFLNVAPIRDKEGRVINFVGTMTDLSHVRKVEESLRESEEKFRSISAAAHDAVIMLDENGAISFWNEAAQTIFGYSADEILGEDLHMMVAPARYHEAYQAGFAKFRETGQGAAVGRTLELAAIRKGGVEFPMEISLSSVRHNNRWLAIGIIRDISERKRAERQLQAYLDDLTRTNAELKTLNGKLEQAQSQLVQSEKMASIGLLAAGVAHEINNPIGFINSNLVTLSGYVADFLRVINAYEKAESLLAERREVFADVDDLKESIDVTYEKEDVPSLLSESQQGIERVKKIVQNLKDFSRLDSEENWSREDIHKGLESTLTVVWNELKYACEVCKEYGNLPPVECVLSQLNQVFMNLLVNAAQSIENKGTITIRTGTAEDQVWIDIADTGKGIPPDQLNRIFDPFFTTKPVGKGTGLGLSVSYSIVEKHHGKIEVASEVGKGTTFRVWLPVSQPEACH